MYRAEHSAMTSKKCTKTGSVLQYIENYVYMNKGDFPGSFYVAISVSWSASSQTCQTSILKSGLWYVLAQAIK